MAVLLLFFRNNADKIFSVDLSREGFIYLFIAKTLKSPIFA
ncbi:hypothetical protein ADICYQ_3134 [Cyclobacterium qasimii M12-11B]|uniref:Uncharacterized protein n=1 Tax=Cyclobacterium qasimii M12-11B TaxID=641524 RepID=S7VES5_9BACT|nr:hypothetical protein ADICYQ_3134 [Cyclobacterium qasimii M12-11B]